MKKRWKPNVTVAAIIEKDGRFLLIEEHTPEGLRLNNPAGHLDPAESPQEGAVREVLEETACEFTPLAVVGIYLGRFQRPERGEDVSYLRIAYSGTVGEPLPAISHGFGPAIMFGSVERKSPSAACCFSPSS
jgi:8-oxo-dGTP pyrophosphatase MutT (NUDIX family)